MSGDYEVYYKFKQKILKKIILNRIIFLGIIFNIDRNSQQPISFHLYINKKITIYIKFKAVGLITNFLQVKIDKRMSVDKALHHQWFSEVIFFKIQLTYFKLYFFYK